LQLLSETKALNKWMFDTILPAVKGNILEIGSGIGNISSQFVKAGASITLSELDPAYCKLLRDKFYRTPKVLAIYQLDLVHPEFLKVYSSLLNSFDTIVALNVVEHIANDNQAIANARSLLASGGHLIILVPAYQVLYNGMDRALDHYRRYTRNSIKQLLSSGFDVLSARYFNLAGIFGWFVSGTIFKKKYPTASPLRLYNKLVPLFRLVDKITFHQVGLSVIAVAQKK
jgi:SAM-dependent methyltransferase